MADLDFEMLQAWLGREEHNHDVLAPRHAALMAATLGLPTESQLEGRELPPLWHWLYFLSASPPVELGRDGHPARGGFLPPVPLSNRMWAGGTLDFLRPVPLGAPVSKLSRIQAIDAKQGRSGPLVFVTVEHLVQHEGETAIRELHDIVYKDRTPPAPRATPDDLPEAEATRAYRPDTTMLFRYSALTFNGHRIHYDADYCRDIEGYPNLVIHGPLNATMLAGFARDIAGRTPVRFRYRGLQPSFLGETLTMKAAKTAADTVTLWTESSAGGVTMRATASFDHS